MGHRMKTELVSNAIIEECWTLMDDRERYICRNPSYTGGTFTIALRSEYYIKALEHAVMSSGCKYADYFSGADYMIAFESDADMTIALLCMGALL